MLSILLVLSFGFENKLLEDIVIAGNDAKRS